MTLLYMYILKYSVHVLLTIILFSDSLNVKLTLQEREREKEREYYVTIILKVCFKKLTDLCALYIEICIYMLKGSNSQLLNSHFIEKKCPTSSTIEPLHVTAL